ncbi:Potassium/sodium efflux p-type atpase, fungal-type, partial [Globisporangium splendens]
MAFSYQGSHTPKLPDGELDRDSHRSRFLSEPEKILVDNPAKTRQSYRVLDSVTTQAGWHDQAIESVLQQLDVDTQSGLTDQEAQRRLAQYGPNALEGDKCAPIWVIFLLQFFNLIIGLLVFAATASIALQEYVEGLAIIAIVTLNAVIATMQENRAGDALEALAKMSSPQCVVVRNARQVQIASDTLVPGDIVMMTTGDIVPADIRLITSSDCKKFDANMPTSTKLTADNMVFASTSIACGNATGVVVETAMGTRVGSIAALLRDKKLAEGGNCCSRFLDKYQTKMTPLQEALHRLGVFMGSAVLVICAIVFIVGMVRSNHDPKNADRPVWLTMVMVAVSLAVSAVPEGLPMVVTICLSTGTSDMVKKNVLVRKLAAVESLGAASVICTDKTGTLTEGKMTAIKVWGDFYEYMVSGAGFDPTGDFLLNDVKQTPENNTQLHTMLLSAVLCSNTTLQQEKNEDGMLVWTPMGNASEAPLVVAAAKMGIWEADLSPQYPRLTEISFNFRVTLLR